MSDDHQPETVWEYSENDTRKTNRGRNWLIAALVVAALAVISVPLYFLLAAAGESEPAPTPTASASASASPTSTPTVAPEETADPEPEPEPTQPAAPEPDLETFIEQVRPRLDTALWGLQLVTDNLDLGAQIVDSLQQDATLLSDAAAPSAIAGDWSSAVSRYTDALNDLRGAYDSGSDPKPALDAADAALQKVRAVVGL